MSCSRAEALTASTASVQLNNGVLIPRVGLGVFRAAKGRRPGMPFGMPCTLGIGTSTSRGSTAMKRMSALRFASLSIAAYHAGRTEYAGK
jgi:hypothetical protein